MDSNSRDCEVQQKNVNVFFFRIYIKSEDLIIKCVPFSIVLCRQVLDKLDVSDRSAFFATGGFLLL